MTSNLRSVINPAALPVSAATCKPIYPNQYLKVNTIFNVVRSAGLRTAFSDKHPSYLFLSGPSGNGVEDFFTPEIASQASGYPAGVAWSDDVDANEKYDGYKVAAVLNEIDGYNHSRTERVGVPALFGMNFQVVTTAEQLPKSDGLTGGYLPGGEVPGQPYPRVQLRRQRARRADRPDQGAGPGEQHRHHHHVQAGPVPDQSQRPQAGQ